VQPEQIGNLQRRIFAGFPLEVLLSFLGGLNENKSPLNPVLRDPKRGPVSNSLTMCPTLLN
jgi:hypothetical protein